MKINKYTTLFLSVILYLSSCAGSKKVDFNTAYKFSRYNYQIANNQLPLKRKDSISSRKLYASSEVSFAETHDGNLARIRQNLLDKINVSKADARDMEPEILANKIKQLDRKEKKAFKKEIKAELKYLKRPGTEYPHSVNERTQTNELTENMRWSIIIGSAGLVLLLIGAIFSVGILSFVGALAIVGAAVLFILDQV